jgi:hypothetical protein
MRRLLATTIAALAGSSCAAAPCGDRPSRDEVSAAVQDLYLGAGADDPRSNPLPSDLWAELGRNLFGTLPTSIVADLGASYWILFGSLTGNVAPDPGVRAVDDERPSLRVNGD